MPRKIEIKTGTVYGNLTYLHDAPTITRGQRIAMFRCICGVITTAAIGNVRAGRTKSCGCGQAAAHRTHGQSQEKGKKSTLYRRWEGMRQRCNNPNFRHYSKYGGRGISVCKEWDDFALFAKWAKSNGYKKSLTIDRKNNNKGYYPSNCRWVNREVQGANRNKMRGTKYKYIGVHQLPAGNWRAVLLHKGKRHHIGVYPEELDAVRGRNQYIKDNKLPHTLNLE